MNIANIIYTIVCTSISIGLFIKGLFDKAKAKRNKLLQSSLEDDNAKYEILNKVCEFCCEAEKVVGKGNGPIKRLFVTCQIDKLAHDKGIIITQEEIDSAIESCLSAPQKKE